MRNLSGHLLAWFGILALAVCFTGCRSKEKEAPPQVGPPPGATASVAGELGVPQGVDAFGIMVFAEGTSHMALTDEQGRYTISGLAVGEFRLRATRVDLESIRLETVKLTEEDLLKPQPCRNLLRALMDLKEEQPAQASQRAAAFLGGLHGRVTLGAGDDTGVMALLEGTRHRTVTIGNGEFEMINVEPGKYRLVLFKDGYDQKKIQVEVIAGQTTELAPVELAARADATAGDRTIFGRVEMLTSDGSEVNDYSGVRVVLEGTSFLATPGRDGRFEFRNLPPRLVVVSATASRYLLERKYEVNLQALPAAEVKLVLIEDNTATGGKGGIVGHVGLEGAPARSNAGIAVSVVGTSLVAFTDAAGNYAIDDVEAGVHDLMASFNGYRSGLIEGLSVSEGGDTEAPELLLEKEVERPVVVFTSPTDGQSRVAIDDPLLVTVQFSVNMNPATVRSAIDISPRVGYSIRADGGGARGTDTFTMELDAIPRGANGALRYGTRYTVTIDGSAANSEGVEMKDAYKFSFTTGYAEIIATNPADGEENARVNFDLPISVFFNAPIERDTIRTEDIRFDPPLPTSANINFKNDPNTGWTIMLIAGYAKPDQRYTVTIRRGVRTITGDRIRNVPYTLRFKTARLRDYGEVYGTTQPDYDVRRRERSR